MLAKLVAMYSTHFGTCVVWQVLSCAMAGASNEFVLGKTQVLLKTCTEQLDELIDNLGKFDEPKIEDPKFVKLSPI